MTTDSLYSVFKTHSGLLTDHLEIALDLTNGWQAGLQYIRFQPPLKAMCVLKCNIIHNTSGGLDTAVVDVLSKDTAILRKFEEEVIYHEVLSGVYSVIRFELVDMKGRQVAFEEETEVDVALNLYKV